MQLDTTRFGVIEIDDASTIDVPAGVPGFGTLRRVALLGAGSVPGHPEITDEHAMYWMQDLDDASLAFLCIDPWIPFPDYDVEIDEEALGIGVDTDVCVLAFVTVRRGDGRATMSANLRAPIVVDLARRRAHQVILCDQTWPVDAAFAVTDPSFTSAVQ
jgi:flagellar assembly factor FliW